MVSTQVLNIFSGLFEIVQEQAHITAKDKGFWQTPLTHGESIALMHFELSQILGAIRAGNPESPQMLEFDSATEKAADVVIRLMDWAQYYGFDLGDAIVAKLKYNDTRPR